MTPTADEIAAEIKAEIEAETGGGTGERRFRLFMPSRLATLISAYEAQAEEIARLRALVEEARVALRPFGTYLDTMPFDIDFNGNLLPDETEPGWTYLNAGSFRRARALLTKLSPPAPTKENADG